jgi:hypothetical protein
MHNNIFFLTVRILRMKYIIELYGNILYNFETYSCVAALVGANTFQQLGPLNRRFEETNMIPYQILPDLPVIFNDIANNWVMNVRFLRIAVLKHDEIICI